VEMNLEVPLLESQIRAAHELYEMLSRWQQKNRILMALKEQFPNRLDPDGTLLKVVVLNQFYNTNVMAVDRMTTWILEIMGTEAQEVSAVEIVEKIAALPMAPKQKVPRNHYSFASKFAHFFIDMERFPIYDAYAVKMVAYHLGSQGLIEDAKYPYKAFVENLNSLKRIAGLVCSTRELDHYLWLAGLYRVWQKNREQQMDKDRLKKSRRHINIEVAELFDASPIEAAMLLTDSNRSALEVLST
jgi:hypothetical protein